MYFQTVDGSAKPISFKEALLRGVGPGGTLYYPQEFPLVDVSALKGLSFTEVALKVSHTLFRGVVPEMLLEKVVHAAFSFPLPITFLEEKVAALELFHGPTLSFKDVGAQFMAQLINEWVRPKHLLTVLVATTGDTGSALGMAFRGIPNTRVCILYPKGKVTCEQEKQLTTLGQNVYALEIEGTFDTCQHLVMQALLDTTLPNLTTGNSINVARLLPQIFYYFYAIASLPAPPVVAVPCGNFGHLVSGIIAKKMGVDIKRFVAATNSNDGVPQFFKKGTFVAKPSCPTLTSSMDVGNPSNFPRLCALYDNNIEKMKRDILATSITDDEVQGQIKELYQKKQKVLDPHSALGYFALRKYREKEATPPWGLLMATAHPTKFANVCEPLIRHALKAPNRLAKAFVSKQSKITLPSTYEALKAFLAT